ncbi:MAG TPA: matrixin family metalloprotease [Candidatus Andersenbacteria bacterium]|nr:matrixin family metalloprotease [Candidatus Andersenbacteria bacterium]
MKIIGVLLPYIVIAGVFYGAVLFLFPAPCSRPISYTIGQVDPQFHVSREQFLQSIEKAEHIWEDHTGKQLFSYTPHSDFTINLVYDTRQQVTDQANALSNTLSTMSSQQKKTQSQYTQALAAYTSAKNAYLQDVQDSKKEYSQLEQERLAVNKLADSVNALATKEEQIVHTYNANAQQFNQLYAAQREFDQGEYTGKSITIYEFSKNNDLQLVLEHELGHALGLGHVENPASIMYYMVNQKNLAATGLSDEDIFALVSQCKKTSFDVFWERLQMIPFISRMM